MKIMTNTRVGLFASLTAVTLLLVTAAGARAAAPAWRITSQANTTVAPEQTITYHIQATNLGTAPTEGAITIDVALPPGTNAVSAVHVLGFASTVPDCAAAGGGSLAGAATVECTTTEPVTPFRAARYRLTAEVEPSVLPQNTLTASVSVEGGGAAEASTVDPTLIGGPPSFGIDAFGASVAADPGGRPSTSAAAHPYANHTAFDINSLTNPLPQIGDLSPAEPLRDALVDLPPGFAGASVGLPGCTASQLANGIGALVPEPLCPSESQVGTVVLRVNGQSGFLDASDPIPLYNMTPPPGAPAEFGFNFVGTLVTLTARVRSSHNYEISVGGRGISEGLPVLGSSFEFWGVPSDPIHEAERACPGVIEPSGGGPTCPSTAPPKPFFRNPTSCTSASNEGIPTSFHVDSWDNPGSYDENGEPNLADPNWRSTTSYSRETPGYPYPTEESTFPEGYVGPEEQGEEVGITGCEEVPFEPEINVQPTTNTADSPSGLNVDLTVPQECWEAKATVQEVEAAICQSDLEDAEVLLPEGMSVNPSSAAGLGACTPEQIGLMTPVGQASPIHFNEKPATCPDSSKIGTVDIETPLLEEHLTGAVYLAQQGQNPFGSLLAMYMVAEGAGVVVKQAGEIKLGANGQLTTVFTNAPQTPFSELHLELFGGEGAALRTPAACGNYTTTSKLTPWSHEGSEGEVGTPIAEPSSTFQITQCSGGGFDPALKAGTENPLAGSYSPLNLRLSREDGTQELAGLSATLPEGLLAKLAGVPYCPDSALSQVSEALGSGAAQIASPSCPAASEIGTVTVGAGAGVNPFYTSQGRVYLAGPYKGAPLSIAVIAPALAGPFDLGSVLVRNALRIDPETTTVTAVSDPFPTMLHGIPLDLRDVRVEVNRPNFTLNPSSCDPMAIEAAIGSRDGAMVNRSDRYQALGCERLAFKPKLALRFSGQTKRTGDPALHATLTMPAGGANIAKARVTLPKGELIDNAHIHNPCTRVQFAAEACPRSSMLGFARAFSPLLDNPLEGPVYFRSNGGERELPDLVADLRGQIHVVLVGYIDAKNERIRNTFALVPDAPVARFTLNLFGGKRGLLESSHDLCKGTNPAWVEFSGHNGKIHAFKAPLKASCPHHNN